MAVITWQNVNAPSLADAAAPMVAAQRSFDTAFARLGDELTRREGTVDRNYQTGKANNTEAFLAEMSKFRTPEELQAAQQSGVLDQMRQQFGAQVDQTAIRQATDLRPGVLQERVMKQDQFDDSQLARSNRPIDEAFKVAIQSGDMNTFNRLVQENPNHPNLSGFLAAQAAQNRNNILATRADTTFGNQQTAFEREGETHAAGLTAKADAHAAAQRSAELAPDQAKLLRAQIAASEASTSAARTRAEVDAAELITKRATAAKEAKAKELAAITKDTVMADGTLGSSDGQKAFMAEVDKAKLPDSTRVDLMYNLEKHFKGGLYNGAPVPASVAIAAFKESEENGILNYIPGWSRRGDDFASLVIKRMKDPNTLLQIEAVEQAKANLLGSLPGSRPTAPTPAPTPAAPVNINDPAAARQRLEEEARLRFGGSPNPK